MIGASARVDAAWPAATFELVRPAPPSIPVIAHVPHASTTLPADVRAEILVDDAELTLELIRLTDWHTDDLFDWLGARGVWLFVNRLSRLVFDPERFIDDAVEAADGKGQGVVYSHGSGGQRLRHDSPSLRTTRIDRLYRPYHAALDELAATMLSTDGSCTIIDCHSFPSLPLPSELDRSPDRPDICIGIDATHTPPELAEALEAAMRGEGFRVERDRPYTGTFVPGAFYGQDPRVGSIMIEVRRGLYIDETNGRRTGDYADVKGRLERAVVGSGVLDRAAGGT